MLDDRPIDLQKLKALIHQGVQAIPIDNENNQAVVVIGDTGVGKSTILSFLSGSELLIRYDGLKPTLDNAKSNKIKIGHDKYSETSIPTKAVIDGMAFYDCPGFKDNKGEEYEISNSFFVQRLLDLYKHVKIVLIVDESHISEARADKLPKLIRNLYGAFKSFDDIKEGVIMIINRAGPQHTIKDYHFELQKMIKLKNQNGYLFENPEREFLQFLIRQQQIQIFKQADKNQKNQTFRPTNNENNLLQVIKRCKFVKSKHIANILSESAKLSIRDFIDEITTRSNYKIEIICAYIIDLYSQKVQTAGKNVNAIIVLKEEVVGLAEKIKSSRKQQILNILQKELPRDKIQDFQEDFASILFFKGIYDKTNTYFSNLINKIYSQLSHLLTKLDKRITVIQKQMQSEKQKQKQVSQQKIREQKREKEKIIAMEHCSEMDDLKTPAKTLHSSYGNLIQEIKSAMRSLSTVQEEVSRVKNQTVTLKRTSVDIDNQLNQEYRKIETIFTQKKVIH